MKLYTDHKTTWDKDIIYHTSPYYKQIFRKRKLFIEIETKRQHVKTGNVKQRQIIK